MGTQVGANSGDLTCTKFTVVNSEGKPMVKLFAGADGGFLGIGSDEGKPMLMLLATE